MASSTNFQLTSSSFSSSSFSSSTSSTSSSFSSSFSSSTSSSFSSSFSSSSSPSFSSFSSSSCYSPSSSSSSPPPPPPHSSSSSFSSSSSSSSSSSAPPSGWDVFLSFYGKDTHGKFTAHLCSALDRAGISTFMDDLVLKKGEEISSGILNAIRGSKMFVVVLSENYACSKWCLDELVEILTCKRTGGCMVLPVFYYVDPSDLRYQKRSFGDALDHHKKHYSVDLIDKWRSALADIAELSGYHLKMDANENEADTVQEIVKNLTSLLSTNDLHLKEYMVGVDPVVEEIYQKLSPESNDVRVVGVCGMGGRDVKLVKQFKEDISEEDIYMMRELKQVDSLELFSYHARKITPPVSFKELSRGFVDYCEGLLLAVKVLGSSLRGRNDVLFWKDKLAKLQKIGENEIQKFIQMGYEESCERQKEIFHDIVVFFFGGAEKDEAIHIFKSGDFFPHDGIPVLVERCLQTITTKDNLFQMHNLINRDIGKEVIHKESKHVNCRRLYLRQENGRAALEKPEGIEKIEGLIIDQTMSTKRHFRPPKLVSLDMPHSKLETLWDGTMASLNLRIINLNYSRNLKSISDLSNLSLVDKLLLRGCRSLQKVHPSIGQLTNMSHLDLVDCGHLKELPESIGHLTNLGHLDLVGCVNLKRLPENINLLTTLVSLNLDKCRNLVRLPEQLGDMKCLKMLDASLTAIEQLPDSIAQLKELLHLRLYSCKKLRKLPEQIGNLKSLKHFNASGSAIEHLPDTFSGLVNLTTLYLSHCSKLKQLPEQLGKMQCLAQLDAFDTASKELPDSIKLLSRLRRLSLGLVRNLPSSIWDLTSLASLSLVHEGMDEINLPDSVNDMKLKVLALGWNGSICLWLPTILCLSSLKTLILSFGEQSFSPDEQYSLSTLSNLQCLILSNWTRSECSFPELPLNLIELTIEGHAKLEILPDLSSLKQLKILYIREAISLQTLLQFPPHLEILDVNGCTSLQDLPDISMLIKLSSLTIRKCNNLRSVSLKQCLVLAAQHKLFLFKVDLPDREVAEWFSYKSSGSTLSFTIPPNSENYVLVVWCWIVYKIKSSDRRGSLVRAVIKNKTKDIEEEFDIILPCDLVMCEVRSTVILTRLRPSMRSGDRIKVSYKNVSHELI